MVRRTYFVTYTKDLGNGKTLIGSFVHTRKSVFPQTHEAFCDAVDYVQKEHGATVTGFTRVI